MKIYFAGSIRGGRKDRMIYSRIIELLRTYGEVLTEHIGDKGLLGPGETDTPDGDIFRRDIDYLSACDVLVAEVTCPSLGVGYEIGRMENQKPILCLYRQQEGKRLSAMIAGNDRLRIAPYSKIKDVSKILEDFFGEKNSQRPS